MRQVLRALGDPDVLGKALRQARLPLARVVYNVIFATVWIAILLCALYLTPPAVSSTKAFCMKFTERFL